MNAECDAQIFTDYAGYMQIEFVQKILNLAPEKSKIYNIFSWI